MSTATPRDKVGKLSLVFLNGPQCMSKPSLPCAGRGWSLRMLHEPVMDPPRHWQIAADPRGCIMDPVMTRLDIAKLPRVFEDGA